MFSKSTSMLPQGSYRAGGAVGSPAVNIPGTRADAGIAIPADTALYLVADNSGSMESKAAEVQVSCDELFRACADPITRDAVRVSVVTFADSCRLLHPLTAPAALVGQTVVQGDGGGTHLCDALRTVIAEIGRYTPRPGRKPLKPFVVIFSDGMIHDAPESLAAARELKGKAYVLTVGFGPDADEATLRELASTPEHYAKADLGQLRQVLDGIGRTVSRYSTVGR
jgi:uncharacterized protein YegL